MKPADETRTELIRRGVKKLRLFGFTNVTDENIMEDEVYRLYFGMILNSSLGNRPDEDEQIMGLIVELKNK